MTTSSKSQTKAKAAPVINTDIVRELAEILGETGLTEIEVERGDLRVRVARGGTVAAAPAAVMAAAPVAVPAASNPAPAAAPAANTVNAVKSPMVGTVYLRPNPDADAFVNPGDTVKEGDTILLIEAMKTFNPITAPRSGKLVEVLVQDSQPVEYGEPLFVIA